jgi:glycosyltransferase involved in cell wall biosynthesis
MTISVVIPSYNCGSTLARSIASALAQTYPPLEVIVVDDGSTDDTAAVAGSFGPAVRYIRQPNAGPSAARNTGLRAAAGEWIALLDADDTWAPRKLELQSAALMKTRDAVLAYTGFVLRYDDGCRRIKAIVAAERCWPLLRYRNCVPHSSVLVRREAMIAAGGYDETLRTCEDWDLWVRLRQHHRFVSLSEPLMEYAVRANSLSADFDQVLGDAERILESTLLLGLKGWRRTCWRRRIRSAQLFSAAIQAEEANAPAMAGALLRRSLTQWPAPSFLPQRGYALARLLLGATVYGTLSNAAKRLLGRPIPDVPTATSN